MSSTPVEGSYRQILRSTSIIGGSSVLNILIGLVRIKVLAVLLGPAGVGLAGLYSSIMSTAGTLVGFGLGSSGVRQIAEAGGEPQALSWVRRALWYANLVLGVLGLLLLWLLREPVSLLGDLIKVATWPMGFILLARGEGRLFFLTELAWLGFYLAGVWLGLPRFGLVATGFMFLLAYGMYFTLIYAIVARINGFRWYASNLGLLFSLALASVLLQVLSRVSVGWTYGAGAVLAMGLSGYSLYQLSMLTQVGGRLGQITARVRLVVDKKKVWCMAEQERLRVTFAPSEERAPTAT